LTRTSHLGVGVGEADRAALVDELELLEARARVRPRLARLPLRLLERRHVVQHRDDPDQHALRVAQRMAAREPHVLAPAAPAGLAADLLVDHGLARGEHPRVGGEHLLTDRGHRDRVPQVHAGQLRRRAAVHARQPLVGAHVAELPVDEREPDGSLAVDRFELREPLERLAAGGQRLLLGAHEVAHVLHHRDDVRDGAVGAARRGEAHAQRPVDLRSADVLAPQHDAARAHAALQHAPRDRSQRAGGRRQELLCRGSQVLRRGPADQGRQPLVHTDEAQVPVEQGQADGRVRVDRLELLEVRAGLLLGALPRRDVAHGGDHAHDRALRGLDRVVGHHVDARQHLVHAHVAQLAVEQAQADGRVAVQRFELVEPALRFELGALDRGGVLDDREQPAHLAGPPQGVTAHEPPVLQGGIPRRDRVDLHVDLRLPAREDAPRDRHGLESRGLGEDLFQGPADVALLTAMIDERHPPVHAHEAQLPVHHAHGRGNVLVEQLDLLELSHHGVA
jgi:hypothetical protein